MSTRVSYDVVPCAQINRLKHNEYENPDYQEPNKPLEEPIYSEVPEPLYSEVPEPVYSEVPEPLYPEIDELLYSYIPPIVQEAPIYDNEISANFPVAEYSLASELPTKVAKKTRRTSLQVKRDKEENERNKKEVEERKKRVREQIAEAKSVAKLVAKAVAAEEREKKNILKTEKKKMEAALKKCLTQAIKGKEEIKRKKKEVREKKKADLVAKKAAESYEVSTESISRMILTAKTFDGKGFRAKEFTEKYIDTYGNTNPYTGLLVDENYDISAAIRGCMYECSPSSNQSWFRHGVSKKSEQVAPWIFYNKTLAEFNDANDWKQWTEVKLKGRDKGKWYLLTEGSNARYDWQIEKYGPKPSVEQIAAATIGRTVGWRK